MEVRDGVVIDELNMIFLLDNSYSMSDGRITQLNNAIPLLKESLGKVAEAKKISLKLRIIAFSDEPIWKVGSVESGEEISSIIWQDLDVVNETYTATAIREANKALKVDYIGRRALRPVVILVTDGNCTEDHSQYLKAIDEMKRKLAGNTGKEKVTRIAIGVADYNKKELEEFASEGIIGEEKRPLVFEVDDTTKLSEVINWVALTSMMSSIVEDQNTGVVDFSDAEFVD